MSDDNPLKESISNRMNEERFTPKKERKERKKFDFQIILIISIIIGLILSLVRLLAYL